MDDCYNVRILPRAEQDLDSIFVWLNDRSPTGARRWLQAFEDTVHRLSTDAGMCGLAAEAGELNKDIRQCMFKTPRGRTYRTVFVLSENNAIILRVRGPGQPPLQDDEF